jgi:hypothetical protein
VHNEIREPQELLDDEVPIAPHVAIDIGLLLRPLALRHPVSDLRMAEGEQDSEDADPLDKPIAGEVCDRGKDEEDDKNFGEPGADSHKKRGNHPDLKIRAS